MSKNNVVEFAGREAMSIRLPTCWRKGAGQHPASQVEELTPRVWKTMFAENPLRSDAYNPGINNGAL